MKKPEAPTTKPTEENIESQFRISYLSAALREAADRVVFRLAVLTDLINETKRNLEGECEAMPEKLHTIWTGELMLCADCGGLVLGSDESEWDGEDDAGVAWVVETYTCQRCGKWAKERQAA